MAYREAPPLTILVVSTPAGLFGLDPATGHQLWSYGNVPDGGLTAIVEHAGPDDAPCVFFYRAGHLACVHRETGEEIWSVGTDIAGPAGLIVRPGHVLLACDGVAECWSSRGERLWTRSLERARHVGLHGGGGYAVETVIACEGVVARDGR